MSWHDGSGNDKRLRIKGVVDLPPAKKPERDPSLPAPEQVEEVHSEVRQALAGEDDHKVGKLFEDLLDDMHSSKSRSHDAIPATLVDKLKVLCPELNAALTGELRILAATDARWGWAFKLDEDGLHVLGRDPQQEGWTCHADEKAVLRAIRDCQGDARHAAGVLVSRARREILATRTRFLFGAEVPVGAIG